ncbi:extracellular solute-binding protein [Paenactinomyces guangxiensis]|uniref:ABC transporter substrate-binding protein n=1 Tax=Paenactinomyces guangxiensis TaxID=1490290 RepID=A0A7W1WNT2_9BACL|nr:ABC transporter substrate-binding protein [Paenactinomyces guangxiensis]MBA4493300.1 ABC transporter substrate-binding protein [Paenactinomyces guangxiensis]MBH8589849.1 ABC transporter substrate-binding protein [Paenactinomyces guangxiensis]
MTKKGWISAFLCMLFIASLLAGCSLSEEAEGEKGSKPSGEITVWVHPFMPQAKQQEKAVRDQIIESFKKNHPEVTVKIEEIPWPNREQKILTALAANQGPDVFYIIPDQLSQFAHKGILEPLSPYLKDYDLSDFSESSLTPAKYKNEIYALPILQSVMSMYYNLDIVKEIGEDPDHLPKTWDEFKMWAAKARGKGKYAVNLESGNTPNMTLYPFIWQAGGQVINDDGKVTINEPESVEAFNYVNDLYKNGWVPADSLTSQSQFPEFRAGKMLAAFGDSSFVSTVKAEPLTFKWTVGPILENKEKVTYGTTGMFAVAKNSKNKKAAVEFVKHMTNEENAKLFNENTRYIPARKSAGSIYDSEPVMKTLVEQAQNIRPGVIHPVGRSIIPAVQAELQAMLSKKKTPQEAADSAAKAIKSEMQKAGF